MRWSKYRKLEASGVISILPIVVRELSVQARRKSTYWIRILACASAVLLTLWLLVVTAAAVPSVSQGKTLFGALSTVALVYCLLIAPLLTADCLSAEKREGTLGLLFLTDLKGYDVILGKLLSASIPAVYGLLALLPMMSLALLFGGVTAGQVVRVGLVLANTLFFALSAGIFTSAISRNERKAAFGAFLLVLAVIGGPYHLEYYLNNVHNLPSAIGRALLTVSPIYAFRAVSAGSLVPFGMDLQHLLLPVHCFSWILLGLASVIVPQVWKDRPKGRKLQTWSAGWQRWRFGNAGARSSHRRRLLDQNPIFWLSSREPLRPYLPWLLIIPMGILGVWISFRYESVFGEMALLLVLTVQLLLKVWFTAEVSARWVDDRRYGAFELLACAPLRLREFIAGQNLALRRQFLWPVLAVVVLALVAWLATDPRATDLGFRIDRRWLLVSIPIMLADFWALRWVGTWFGLTAPGLNRAILQSLARVFAWRWGIVIVLRSAAMYWAWIHFRPITAFLTLWQWLVIAVGLDVLIAFGARRRFYRHFRVIAANPTSWKVALRELGSQPADAGAGDGVAAARPRRRSWGWLKLTAVGVGAALITAGVIAIYHWTLVRRVERRLGALAAAGVPLNFDQLISPPVVAGGVANAAAVFEQIQASLVPPEKMSSAVRNNLPRRSMPVPLPPATRTALAQFLEANEIALQAIHGTPSLKMAVYAADARLQGPIYRAQSEGLARTTAMLVYEAYLAADEGNASRGLNAVQRLIELIHSLQNEGTPGFSHLRESGWRMLFDAMEALLGLHGLSDGELGRLQQELSELRNRLTITPALTYLRCAVVEQFRNPQSPMAIGRMGPNPTEVARVQMRDWAHRALSIQQREFLRALDTLEAIERASHEPWPERLRRLDQLKAASQERPPGYFSINYVVFQFGVRAAEWEAACQTALTAIAIERYRLRRGGVLPAQLPVLAPGFLPVIPVDPFDGQTLRYQVTTTGYRVYSIGGNRRDEGGTKAPVEWQRWWITSNPDVVFSVRRSDAR